MKRLTIRGRIQNENTLVGKIEAATFGEACSSGPLERMVDIFYCHAHSEEAIKEASTERLRLIYDSAAQAVLQAVLECYMEKDATQLRKLADFIEARTKAGDRPVQDPMRAKLLIVAAHQTEPLSTPELKRIVKFNGDLRDLRRLAKECLVKLAAMPKGRPKKKGEQKHLNGAL